MKKKIDWTSCLLDDVVVRMTNGSSVKQYSEKVGFPITRIETIWDEKIDLGRVKYIEEKDDDIIEKYGLAYNDILLSHINSDNHLGKTAIYKNQTNVLIHGINLLLLRPSAELIADFLLYQLRFLKYKGAFIDVAQRAVNQSSINQRKLKAFKIFVAPLPEQRSIVAKIEQLFSELDNGIANLQKAQEQLKVYRQAVLKQAFEGELTKAWRAQHTDLPTAEELLKQIEAERKAHYQHQLEEWKLEVTKWQANGKEGRKPAKPKAIKLFNEAEKELNLSIPACWNITCLGNLSSGVEYGTSAKSTETGLVPVIRMGNMQGGKIDWTDLKYTDGQEEIQQYLLKEGDVLFNRTNSPELVGKTVYYNGERPALFAGYLIRINHIREVVLGEYINYFLNSHPAKVYGSFVKTDGVNQSNINGQKLSNYPFPICSFSEQQQIVQEIESRLSICDKVEETIRENLDKAEALRQSILKQAFEGKLLSEKELQVCRQETDWEPAEKLLERIKVEKTGSGKAKKKKGEREPAVS